MEIPPVNYSQFAKPPKRRWYVAPAIVAAAWLGMFVVGRLWNGPINVVNSIAFGGIRALISGSNDVPTIPLKDDPDYQMPDREPDRLDILLMGMRGEEEENNGNYLTDTIMILSIDERTNEASFVSVPRDLYVRITDTVSDKINSAYLRLGQDATKRLFSRITGVYIDHIAIIDFQAFKSIVDDLDGITVTLDAPFSESQQWAGDDGQAYIFSLPAGENHLNGEQALYYVRSRYSTSDFDRSRRQQQVILAIKNRVSAIGLLTNPITSVKLLNSVRKHVTTDLDIFDVGTLTRLARLAGDADGARRYVIHSENLLYETVDSKGYRLLPRDGTLEHLKAFMRELPAATRVPIINPTPTPTPES